MKGIDKRLYWTGLIPIAFLVGNGITAIIQHWDPRTPYEQLRSHYGLFEVVFFGLLLILLGLEILRQKRREIPEAPTQQSLLDAEQGRVRRRRQTRIVFIVILVISVAFVFWKTASRWEVARQTRSGDANALLRDQPTYIQQQFIPNAAVLVVTLIALLEVRIGFGVAIAAMAAIILYCSQSLAIFMRSTPTEYEKLLYYQTLGDLIVTGMVALVTWYAWRWIPRKVRINSHNDDYGHPTSS